MQIRPAKFADIKLMVPFLMEANALTVSKNVPIDVPTLTKTLQQVVNTPGNQAFLSFDGETLTGVLAGVSNQIWFSKKKQVVDLVFYVSPEHRGHGFYLARRYLAWAKNVKGAVEVFLGATSGLDTDRTEELYQKLGLDRVGATYRLGVSHVESA